MKSFLIHSTLIRNRAHIAKTTAQAGCKHCCLTFITVSTLIMVKAHVVAMTANYFR